MTKNGAWLGIKTGFFGALIYAPLVLLVLSRNPLSIFLGVLVAIPLSLVAALLGALIGWLIKKDLSQARFPSNVRAALVGLVISLSLVLVIHLLFTNPVQLTNQLLKYFDPAQSASSKAEYSNDWSHDFSLGIDVYFYLAVLGIPSLICIAAGGWMGVQLNNPPQRATALPPVGFAAIAPTDFIKEYIGSRRLTHSRYEIDLALLRRGHSPDEIEAAWQTFAPPASKERRFSLVKVGRRVLVWQTGLLVACGLIIFVQPFLGLLLFLAASVFILIRQFHSHYLAIGLLSSAVILMIIRLTAKGI